MARQASFTKHICSIGTALIVLALSTACGVVGEPGDPAAPANPLDDQNNSRVNGVSSVETSGFDAMASYGDLVAVSDAGAEPEPEAEIPSNPETEVDPIPEDAAEVLSASFPNVIQCGEETTGSVTMRNIGSATWTRDAGYKLGAVDGNDPFKIGDTRVWLKPGEQVPPGEEYTFIIEMAAGNTEGIFTTDWQMVHEGTAWFGEMTYTDIEAHCAQTQAPLPLPDMSNTVQAYAAAHPDQLANSCQDDPGGNWDFLDGLVDLLRETDDRWGYNWKRGIVGDPSRDVLDYHYGSGEREGSEEVYIIDVIVGHCGPNPQAGWLDQTQVTLDAGTIGRWTGRGRF